MVAPEALAPGRHQLILEFDYDGGGVGRGADLTLQVDGRKVASGRLERTCPFMFSTHETMNVGVDLGTPVLDYGFTDTHFSGHVARVDIELHDEIAPEDPDGMHQLLLAVE